MLSNFPNFFTIEEHIDARIALHSYACLILDIIEASTAFQIVFWISMSKYGIRLHPIQVSYIYLYVYHPEYFLPLLLLLSAGRYVSRERDALSLLASERRGGEVTLLRI